MQGLVSADLDRKARRRSRRHADWRYRPRPQTDRFVTGNQGDIDTQAIAGALSTGTHGTGWRLAVFRPGVGMRLIQSDGSVLDLEADRILN